MGLVANDLEHMVYNIFEIDSFKSKMGSDEDIITLSFSVKEQNAAKDLETFLERGYPFVLDADVTSGEQRDGTYKVFVELERTKEAPLQITEIVDGVKKLAGLDEVKFRYYKNFRSNDATSDNLTEIIPVDKDSYKEKISATQMENYKYFFNKSYVDNVELLENKLTIEKKFADSLNFELVDFDKTNNININEAFSVDAFAEVIWLTKYLGDYNISKYGSNIVLENEDYSLILRRI